MKSKLVPLAFAACILAAGCSKSAEPEKPSTPEPSKQTTAQQQPTGSTETVAPMGGVGAGPMTPVSGSDSVAGGGSGVGSSMKAKAKSVAGQASQGTAGEETGE